MTGNPIITPIISDAVEPTAPVAGLPNRRRGDLRARRLKRERRKNRRDRRKDVRDGVVVTLSSTNDRRQARERRKVQ